MPIPALREKLVDCFRTVFPEHSADSLQSATPDTIERWDSENHILLLNVVEETFGIELPGRAADEFLSFDQFERFLKDRV